MVMKNDTSKSTVLVITVGFLAIFILFSWRWALITAFTVGIIGIISSTASRIIDKWWMSLAHLLGSVVTPIVLSVIFFLILVPVSFISRLFTKDPLMLSEKYNTYFVDVDKRFDKSSFEKTW